MVSRFSLFPVQGRMQSKLSSLRASGKYYRDFPAALSFLCRTDKMCEAECQKSCFLAE